MKSLVMFFVTMTMGLSIAAADGANGSGGGNSLGGKMIESYIVDVRDLPEANLLRAQLRLIREKSPDMFDVIATGITRATWYFIPASLKELSSGVTGVPFGSNQTAIQVFETREIWVDINSYQSLKTDAERVRLIIHEALLAGINSLFMKRTGSSIDDRSKKYGKGYVFRDAEFISDIKAVIRPTVALLTSTRLTRMAPRDVLTELRLIGWNTSKSVVSCAVTFGAIFQKHHSCTEIRKSPSN